MLNLFLQGMTLSESDSAGALGIILAMLAGFLIVFLIVGIALWIYSALAFKAIAKKAGDSMPNLAWIPGLGPVILCFRISKMPWWPWLFLIGVLFFWIPFVGMVIYSITMIAFGVFSIIWLWKTFEVIGKPGWWALLCLISPVNLILIGIAAWSKK